MQKISPPKSAPVFFLLLGGAVLCGLALGYGTASSLQGKNTQTSTVTREGGYQFVNPLLSCDINDDSEYPPFAGLKRKLQNIADALVREGKVTRISVYFRDMNNAGWTGVNVEDNYIPASLVKVPLLIAYLHESQNDATLLSKTLMIPGGLDQNMSETFKPQHPLAHDTTYSIETLMSAMIVGSDNNAFATLNGAIATTSINNAYEQLGIMPPADDTSESMSPKTYMRAFRILYNASYLWRANSQKALEILSETEFKDGIVAGVPIGTPVAHKFGERTVSEGQSASTAVPTKRELHDCGIVYYSGSPYGLCIMTEGRDFNDLKSAIASVSQETYAEVKNGLLKNAP